MALKSILLALLASSLPTALAAPKISSSASGAAVQGRAAGALPKNMTFAAEASSNAPTYYSGPWYNFPAMDTWLSFGDMFDANKESMVAAGSTWDDVGRIAVAIEDAAAAIGVDERVILGIIMEESHGYVGVETTYDADGEPTGGLMQASGCSGYDGQNNLAQADTLYMVTCGTQHYKQNLQDWGDAWSAESIYPALREYNSGSVDSDDLSVAPGGVGNPYYVSDISQRFQGWTD
ncbi:hypothetical protein VSDG_05443 [Cytospora chrysosperma]|uniref:Transglycosylase SLT domain-containing protein n=1 Tax=Cytospora chrysosperma TaxID=252740 RepID=A0A423VZI4_CYTCH|nr:hypothetical protein VSDG_05443 [Valsa sordida]